MRRLICLLPTGILFFSFPAASGFQSTSNLKDSQSGNIKGQIVVNSAGGYPSIQEAIDLASTRGGGVVLVPSGRYIVRQIVLRYGVSLKGLGMNGAPHGEGTTLEQASGANTDFIVSDTNLGPLDNQHWSVISNVRIKGNEDGTTRAAAGFVSILEPEKAQNSNTCRLLRSRSPESHLPTEQSLSMQTTYTFFETADTESTSPARLATQTSS